MTRWWNRKPRHIRQIIERGCRTIDESCELKLAGADHCDTPNCIWCGPNHYEILTAYWDGPTFFKPQDAA